MREEEPEFAQVHVCIAAGLKGNSFIGEESER